MCVYYCVLVYVHMHSIMCIRKPSDLHVHGNVQITIGHTQGTMEQKAVYLMRRTFVRFGEVEITTKIRRGAEGRQCGRCV